MQLYDTNAQMQVIGGLIKNPNLYNQFQMDLKVDDFHSSFVKNIFIGISNLYKSGADHITVVDLDVYLSSFPSIYSEFKSNDGIAYIQDCSDIATPQNFEIYFKKIKKFSALRQLDRAGFDISSIYRQNFLSKQEQKQVLGNFQSMKVQEIFQNIQNKLNDIQYKYDVGKKQQCDASTGALQLKQEFKRSPEIGNRLMGYYFNIISRGARKGKYYLNSAGTGVGKSRSLIGNACLVAYPYQYDLQKKQWVQVGGSQKTLIVTTELRKDEVQSIILANLSGVNEQHILYGTYYEDQEERVDRAIQIMTENPNLYIEDVPDPNIDFIKSIIKKHVMINGVVNVFYDYIFSSPNLLGQFRDLKIREDVALLMLSTALKDLAVEHNLYVESSTQLSGDYQNFQGIRNHTLIRGSKSIVDKADLGCITAGVTQKDKTQLAYTCKKLGVRMPNQVKDIYKVRRSRYKNVRIWGYMDLGTARWTDLFVTDANYNVIPVSSPDIDYNPLGDMRDLTAAEQQKKTAQPVKVDRKQQFDAWSYGI